MKNKSYRKTLVIVIILLIVGIGVKPSIGGYNGEICINSTKKIPNICSSDDYIDSYWKFDECNGDTLEDSSGHNYDGTIYESTWTTGQSGCALDFDGVDDYVNLDMHAVDLAFNKTDDLIFSVWFRTESSNGGLIYCISGPQSVPEARLEICPNGSILFKVWTSVCGISCYSSENYNDKSWHHAEIYFNGITAKPTIEIYIDNDFDGEITHWLCEIANTDFNKAKIGRRAQTETNYFNGRIDEFKIIKYPGGNDQDIPDISGPTSGSPGFEYEYTFTAEDPEGDEIWFYIDWDDTTFEDWFGPFPSGTKVYVSHSWYETGTYGIKAKSMDYWDDSPPSAPYLVSIGNSPPDIPVISGPITGGVGAKYGYSIVSNDIDGDDIYYYIDWDDGTNSGWNGPYPSGQSAKINHTWTSPGTYYIKGKAKDIYNDESSWTDTIIVTIVENNLPTTPTINGPSSGKPGNLYTYNFKSTDPDGDDISYYIKWGDGNITSWTTFQSSGTEYTESHKWIEIGTYIIEAMAKDIYGAESGWGEMTVKMTKNLGISSLLVLRFLEKFPLLEKIFYQLFPFRSI
ncbi:hypothetical protein AYK20_04305 [Thermoplasmatales archaeon SG8-52-1]|nr:MAG: hypothetical protein AYK20_04305 [Thermoplasmatales archaeon SG8-52-1]